MGAGSKGQSLHDQSPCDNPSHVGICLCLTYTALDAFQSLLATQEPEAAAPFREVLGLMRQVREMT